MNKNYVSGLSELLDRDGWEEAISLVVDNLPHGSGIDSTWGIYAPKNKNKVYFTNSYHCMDEYGGYDGWLDFQIAISYNDFFRVVKNIKDARHYKHYESKNRAKEFAIVLTKLQVDDFELTFSWSDKRVADKYAWLLRDCLEYTFAYYFQETLPEVIQNL